MNIFLLILKMRFYIELLAWTRNNFFLTYKISKSSLLRICVIHKLELRIDSPTVLDIGSNPPPTLSHGMINSRLYTNYFRERVSHYNRSLGDLLDSDTEWSQCIGKGSTTKLKKDFSLIQAYYSRRVGCKIAFRRGSGNITPHSCDRSDNKQSYFISHVSFFSPKPLFRHTCVIWIHFISFTYNSFCLYWILNIPYCNGITFVSSCVNWTAMIRWDEKLITMCCFIDSFFTPGKIVHLLSNLMLK